MTKAANIELALYRSGLLRAKINPRHLELACKGLTRHVARIDRHRVNACNGINRWDQQLQRMMASWTEDDQAKADKETADSREAIQDALRAFLTPGCVWNWYTDPRAGVVARIRDKDNRRDAFL